MPAVKTMQIGTTVKLEMGFLKTYQAPYPTELWASVLKDYDEPLVLEALVISVPIVQNKGSGC